MHRRILMFLAAGLVSLGLAGSALVGPAQAAANRNPWHDSVARDFTRVAVAPALYRKLQHLHVTPSSTKGADIIVYNGTPAYRFTITHTTNHHNKIFHVGGIKLSAGGSFIAIKAPTVKVRQGYVSGVVVVNGDRVGRTNVFKLLNSHRPKYGQVRLVLTTVAARAINQTFGIHRFSQGENVGFASVVVH